MARRVLLAPLPVPRLAGVLLGYHAALRLPRVPPQVPERQAPPRAWPAAAPSSQTTVVPRGPAQPGGARSRACGHAPTAPAWPSRRFSRPFSPCPSSLGSTFSASLRCRTRPRWRGRSFRGFSLGTYSTTAYTTSRTAGGCRARGWCGAGERITPLRRGEIVNSRLLLRAGRPQARIQKRHLGHHYRDSSRNFGVSSPVFDVLFGTLPAVTGIVQGG